MAKAKTLVGLDVHATKIVATVLDAETGQLQTFSMDGDTAGAAGFCAGYRGRCGWRMRLVRRATAWRASSHPPRTAFFRYMSVKRPSICRSDRRN